MLFVFALFGATACATDNDDETDKGTIVIAAPDGAPVLSMYELLASVEELDGYKMEYTILSGSQNIGTTLLNGDADIAIMPTNVAAKLYNNGADIKLLSVNVFGILYMVGNTPFENGVEDLKGKVLLVIGQGGSPDITTKYILASNNVEYVTSETAVEGKVAIRYVSAASEVIQLLKAGSADYGVLGEPAATQAVTKIGVQIVYDMQSAWDTLSGNEDSFTQAGVVLTSRVYNDSSFVKALIEKLTSNLSYIYENVDSVKETIVANGSSLQVDFTSAVLDRCNLDFKRASEIKTKIEAYYNAVYAYDATFIGGKLPDDGFYY